MTPPPGGSGTTSGKMLEEIIVPIAERNGYEIKAQARLKPGIGGGDHWLDALVTAPNGDQIALSLKWQAGPGSVDEKVPYEIVKLLTLKDSIPQIKRLYIIIGGKGFRERLLKYYRGGDISPFIPRANEVIIADIDEIMTLFQRKAI
jgi:hypothetical protein